MGKRICDHALDVLKETGSCAVMWGDVRLLHTIAERAGLPSEGPQTPRRILAALSRTPGVLVPGTATVGGRRVRAFRLPAHEAFRLPPP